MNVQESNIVQNLTFPDLLQDENLFQNKIIQDEQISNLTPIQNKVNLNNTFTETETIHT